MNELVSPFPFLSFSAKYPTVSSLSDLKKSYLRHNDKKIPGSTISPNPKIEYWGGSAVRSLGNYNLIGASIFLATVIIISVPNTKKIS